MTLPNLLTFFRILLIPALVYFFYSDIEGMPYMTAMMFALAGITDWLDGYLARKWQQESNFGAFLDPVADKLIVATALLLIIESNASIWITLPGIIILGRELSISALREWMARVGKSTDVAVSYIGKIKTSIQMLALFILLLPQSVGTDIINIGFFALYVATSLTLWSMLIYLKAAWPSFKH